MKLVFAVVLFFGSISFGFAQETIEIQTSAVCKMCKARLDKDLSLTKGVKKAELDLETKKMIITYKPKKTSPEKLREVISKIGYDADEVKAVQKAHDALPDCCQKTVKPH